VVKVSSHDLGIKEEVAALYVFPINLEKKHTRIMLNYADDYCSIGGIVRVPGDPRFEAKFKRERMFREVSKGEGKAPGELASARITWRGIFIKPHLNPIIAPNPSNYWEAYQTFNPGAIILDGRIHIVYRALGVDWISRFGYAASTDGVMIDERHSHPIYQSSVNSQGHAFSASGGGFGGCEDPRLVRIDDAIYMTYNLFDSRGLRVGLTSISVEDFLNKRWRWSEEKIISNPGKINKNFVLFPEKINGRYAILHSISPRIQIAYLEDLSFEKEKYIESYHEPRSYPGGWESMVKGAGGPPIKTSEGWLLFYHGLSRDEPWKYKIGLMLLDLDNPERVLYRARSPVIEADQWYEREGFKPGVTYTCGAVVKNGELFLYYGAADKYVCVAKAPLDLLLDALKREGAAQS
ncbi:MAG: hypothetical protein QXF72_07160, partial [Nitrososphaerota archaeon]